MMTNPSLETTNAAPASTRSNVGSDDLQRFSERFEQALRDVEDRGAGGSEAAPDPPHAEAQAGPAAHDDDGGEHDARDDASADELAAVAVAAATVTTPPLQAAASAHAVVVGAASDPNLAASATQGAIGAGLNSNTLAAASLLAAPGESPSAWSLTLPGLQAWSMRATQPQAGGAWTLELVAPAGHNAMPGAADASAIAGPATIGAKVDAATLAAQAQVLSQRLSARDVAVDRVTLRRRGVGDAADSEDLVTDAATPGAIDGAKGHRPRE